MTTSRLTEIEARLAAATPGPWEARDGLYAGKTVVGPREEEDLGRGLVTLMSPTFWTERSARNAELIAHAPADLVALLAVMRAVERLHRPHPDGGQGYDQTGEYVWFDQVCATCGQYDEYGVPWPCPTAAAVQKLGDA